MDALEKAMTVRAGAAPEIKERTSSTDALYKVIMSLLDRMFKSKEDDDEAESGNQFPEYKPLSTSTYGTHHA